MSYGLRYKTILQSFLARVLNEEVTTFSVLKFASPFARTSHKNKKKMDTTDWMKKKQMAWMKYGISTSILTTTCVVSSELF